jgi:hypothetical protein
MVFLHVRSNPLTLKVKPMRAPKGALAHQARIDAKLKRDTALKNAFEYRTYDVAQEVRDPAWLDYTPFPKFQRAVAWPLKDFGFRGLDHTLTSIGRTKGKPVRVYDEAAGNGHIGAGIRTLLELSNRSVQLTATDANPSPSLRKLHQDGIVNTLVEGQSEKIVPTEPQDLIISNYGGPQYTVSPLRKELTLKLADSLSRKGLLMATLSVRHDMRPDAALLEYVRSMRVHQGVEVKLPKQQERVPLMVKARTEIQSGLSERPKTLRQMPITTELSGIERSFQKRGFKAKFYPIGGVPERTEYLLLVQRAQRKTGSRVLAK